MTLLLSASSRRTWWLAVACLPLLLRALTFSGSRGAYAAELVAITALIGLLATVPATRARAFRLGAAAMVLAAGVLVVMPDIAERPTVRRALTLSSGVEASTFEWRREQRWPHFWELAVAHPWLGMGTDMDTSLGDSANTPHNGYLSIAVRHGFPALAIVLTFAFLGLRDSLRVFRDPDHPWGRLLGAMSAVSLLALLVHNLVDDAFLLPFTAKMFWTWTGVASVAARRGLAGDAVEPAKTQGLQPFPELRIGFER